MPSRKSAQACPEAKPVKLYVPNCAGMDRIVLLRPKFEPAFDAVLVANIRQLIDELIGVFSGRLLRERRTVVNPTMLTLGTL